MAEPNTSSSASIDDILVERLSNLRRLTILLRLADSAWALALYEHGAIRRAVTGELAAALAPIPLIDITIVDTTGSLLDTLDEHTVGSNASPIVFSLHSFGERFAEFCGQFDRLRDLLAQRPERLLIWLSENERRELARLAPNFYSRISGVFRFPGGPAAVDSPFEAAVSYGPVTIDIPGDPSIQGAPTAPGSPERLRRLDYLRRRATDLAALPNPDYQAIARVWSEYAGLVGSNEPRDWSGAEIAYIQAAGAFRKAGDLFGQAEALRRAGEAARQNYAYPRALEHLGQALDLYEQLGRDTVDQTVIQVDEARTLHNIGAVYSALGEKRRALEHFEQALEMLRRVGDVGGEAATLNNIGGVYSDLGEKRRALEHYEQALPLRRRVGDVGGEAATLNNIGAVYRSIGEPRRALEHFEQALEMLRRVGDVRGEAVTRYNMAMIYRGWGDLAPAEEQLVLVVALDKQYGLPDLESDRAMLERVRAERYKVEGIEGQKP